MLARVGILLAVAATLGGCGTAASEQDVTAVVQRFQEALAVRDGDAACAQLMPATSQAIAGEQRRPCPRAVLSLGLRGGGRVSGADVYLTNGIAHVGDATAFLDQTPAGWRISAAGCAPTRDGLPYDCELEH
jgi:hypothetical protein